VVLAAIVDVSALWEVQRHDARVTRSARGVDRNCS
jgi:hypothetical protein